MGLCCSRAAQQTVPNTTAIHAERNTETNDPTNQTYKGWSSTDDNYDEVDTQCSATENDVSVSITIERKQKIIDGFKDAVEKGNDSLVMYYVEEHPSLQLLETYFSNGDNALHIAVRQKAYNLIIYLLSQGISPNSQNEINGDSPLHTAARIREVKCVALLYKYDADIAITNNEHETALTIASENGDEDIMLLLSNNVINIHQHENKKSHILSTMNDDRLEHEFIAFSDDILKDNNNKKELMELEMINENAEGSLEHLEALLDAESVHKLQEIKIARRNPFNKLRRDNTMKALEVMERITNETGKLPILEAWLEKKRANPLGINSWQKRWVIVKQSHFLWSDKQRNIKDPKSAKERAKFNGNFNLMCIIEINAITKSKSQRKFRIIAKVGKKSQTKEFLFKAACKPDRDYWVQSLNMHVNHMRDLLVYLGTKQ